MPDDLPFAARLDALRRDSRVVALLAGAVALAAAVAWLWAEAGPGARPPAPAVGPETTTVTTAVAPEVVLVHVVGAVRAPGVVELPAGARVVDAVHAAGGAGDDADLDRVNLAATLADGQRVAVPRVGEPVPPEPAPVGGGDATAGGTGAGDPLRLNAATAEELEDLPGIGPTLAAAIVRTREEIGGFRSVDDLQRVPGIGPARLAQIRDLVTL
jgi:competence protein ComEA